MKKNYVAVFVLALIFIILYSCKKNNPSAPVVPANTATASPTFSGTPTITQTSTVTETSTITETSTLTPTETETFTFTTTPTPLSSDRTDTIGSVASMDGMLSNGGYTDHLGQIMNVGDNSSGYVFQSFVDFYLPWMSGPITSATLNVYLTGSNGNPITDIGQVHVAMKTFGVDSFMEYTGLTSIGVICASTTPGWYSLDVTAEVDNLRASGIIYAAFSLYCAGFSDYDAAWDNVKFATAESGANSPTLVLVHR